MACAVVDQNVVMWHTLLYSDMRNCGSNKLERFVPEIYLRGRTWGRDVNLAMLTTEPTVDAVISKQHLALVGLGVGRFSQRP